MQSFNKFYAAVEQENVGEVEKIINDGFDLNEPDEEGATALFFAILQGNVEIVQLLLEKGANADVTIEEPAASIFTEKPLDLAQQLRFLTNWEKYNPIVKLLEKFGAKDFEGRTDFTEEQLKVAEEKAKQWQKQKSEN